MILTIIFWLLIFIIFTILFVISLSYNYHFNLKYDDSFSTEIYFGNKLFNYKYIKNKNKQKSIIKFLIYKKEITKVNKNDKEKKEKIDKTKPEKNKSQSSFPYKLINKKNLKHILKFLYTLYNKIKPDSLKINLVISFSDPYYNGLLLANYYSLKGVYPNLPFSITTYWNREVIEGQGKIKGKIKPIVILFLIFKFVLSPRTLKILWQYHKN